MKIVASVPSGLYDELGYKRYLLNVYLKLIIDMLNVSLPHTSQMAAGNCNCKV